MAKSQSWKAAWKPLVAVLALSSMVLLTPQSASAYDPLGPTNDCLVNGGEIFVKTLQLGVENPSNITLLQTAPGSTVYSATIDIAAICVTAGTQQPIGEVPNSEVAFCLQAVNPLFSDPVANSENANCLILGSLSLTQRGSIVAGPDGVPSVAVIDLGPTGFTTVTIESFGPAAGTGGIQVFVGIEQVMLTEAYNCDLNSPATGTTLLACPNPSSDDPSVGDQYFLSPIEDSVIGAQGAVTPELDSFVLFGFGALVVGGYAWKRRKAAQAS